MIRRLWAGVDLQKRVVATGRWDELQLALEEITTLLREWNQCFKCNTIDERCSVHNMMFHELPCRYARDSFTDAIANIVDDHALDRYVAQETNATISASYTRTHKISHCIKCIIQHI
jgi:hypothetical protein